jgi:SNF2 family DNA or RNA helicase
MEYQFATEPFKHQKIHFENHKETPAWGLLWEQGTAKTKPVIDTAAYLYLKKEINGLLVVAPPGVERNWNTDEIPAHLPPNVALETRVEVFMSKKKGTKEHKWRMDSLRKFEGLAVLLISYDAFMTEVGKNVCWKFLRDRRCLYVLDESHSIKSPSAKRTLSINKSSIYAPYRRILTGTPMAKGPFDLYSQIKFLDGEFWKNRGINGAVEFRQFFGEWLTRSDHQRLHGYDPGYDKLIRYKNLDKLAEWLSQISDRVLKEDVLSWLPPKLYQKKYVEMSKEQTAAYRQLEQEFYFEFSDGAVVDAELAMVRLLRFQQVLCGYLPVEKDEPVRLLDGKNPRLEAMEDIRDITSSPTIVWARFRKDIDQLMDLLGPKACRYDGTVDEDTAERNKLGFQAGDYDWFVGTQAKGGPGLTLHRAKQVIYYSNSFKLIDRLQSEDRAHRAGMDNNPVNYIDLVVPGTVDEHIVANLRDKVEIASAVTGDRLKEWI